MTADGPVSGPAEPVANERMPLRHAGTFFVFTVVGAVAVALFTGDPQLLWAYVGAFTLTVSLGIGMALRADQHNRSLASGPDPPLP